MSNCSQKFLCKSDSTLAKIDTATIGFIYRVNFTKTMQPMLNITFKGPLLPATKEEKEEEEEVRTEERKKPQRSYPCTAIEWNNKNSSGCVEKQP